MTASILHRAMINSLPVAAALAVCGCWTAPVANVQPKGEPRLIQNGIAVESVKDPAIVQSVDPGTRTLVVATPKHGVTATYKAGPQVENFDRIRAGDKVRATVAEELSVYVLRDGQLPGAGGTRETIVSDARVLWVDPSYRLLTLRYPDGRNETLKVGLEVKLREMEAGDDVVIRTVEVLALQAQRR